LPIIAAIAAVIVVIVLLIKHWDKVKEVALIVWDAIVKKTKDSIAKIKGIINTIKGVFLGVWTVVKRTVSRIKNAFNSVKNAIITNFKAVKSVLKRIFSGIASIIRAPINGIIYGVNRVLRKINGVKIPNWVPKIGGSHSNFQPISTLAEGGIVNKATQAIIGEGADPEAVVPLNKKGINSFVSGLGMNGGVSGQTIHITIPQQTTAMVDLNGSVIGNIVLPQITKKIKLGGGNIWFMQDLTVQIIR